MRAFAFLFAALCAAAPLTLKSPDGRVEIGVALNDRSVPAYNVSFNGTPVKNPEQLKQLVTKAGKHVALLVQRDQAKLFVPVDLG